MSIRYGIALEAGEYDSDSKILAALDAWGPPPDMFPTWGWKSQGLVDALHSRGIMPVIYFESSSYFGQVPRPVNFSTQSDIIVRIDQEMNTRWVPWRMSGVDFIEHFRKYVDTIRKNCPNALIHWCPQAATPDHLLTMEKYWPGEAYVNFAGFDKYDFKGAHRPMDQMFAPAVKALRQFTGAPILIGETGTPEDIPGAAKWVASLSDLKGVDGIIMWDRKVDTILPDGTHHVKDWTLRPAARRTYQNFLLTS
jgi:hypothetical protein